MRTHGTQYWVGELVEPLSRGFSRAVLLFAKMDRSSANILIEDRYRNGYSATQTYNYLLEKWPELCQSYSTIARKLASLRRNENINIRKSGSGAKKTARDDENIQLVRDVLTEDPTLSIRSISESLGISSSSIHRIIRKNLQMRKLCCRWVPHALTTAQKHARVTWCKRMLDTIASTNGSVLNRLVTLDETWLYYYEPSRKRQSMEWKCRNQPNPTKVVASRSTRKVGVTLIFDRSGWYKILVLPDKTTWNATYMVNNTLPCLLKEFHKRRPVTGFSRMILHWDNAPSHNAEKTGQLIVDNNIEESYHPPYSPDLAPCDFFLFPKLKQHLRGKRYRSTEEILATTEVFLKSIKKSEWAAVFDEWKHRMQKCIDKEGEYFEKI